MKYTRRQYLSRSHIHITTNSTDGGGKLLTMAQLERTRDALRHNMLETIRVAHTGHLGACCSSLELMAALYFGGVLRLDIENPRHPLRDYVLNRGHLGPLKYNILQLLGWLDLDEMSQYRQYGSRLAGHEDMKLTPGVDITPSGSLGMTLSYGVGAAIGFRDRSMPNRVFAFLGDGEEEEGNVAEAARHAVHERLKRLICVIDRNGGQLSTRTVSTDSSSLYDVWSGYGWSVVELPDGHDLASILSAYNKAVELAEEGPVCIIAETIKGHGVPGAQDDYNGFHVYHGSEPGEIVRPIDIGAALAELSPPGDFRPDMSDRRLPDYQAPERQLPSAVVLPKRTEPFVQYHVELDVLSCLERELGEKLYVFTSDYPPRNFVYDGDGMVLKRCRYHNVGLREQHMTALIQGLAQVRPEAFFAVLCGDAFLYRHMDQINVLAQSETPVVIYSVQGGLSGAKNGSTHQSSGQPGAVYTMPGMTHVEPCTAEDFIDASNQAFAHPGPTYIRIQKMPIPWALGGERHRGFEVVDYDESAVGTLVSSGMTTPGALAAQRSLKLAGRHWNLINLHTLSDCLDFGKWILGGKPLKVLYNGGRKTIAAIVYEAIWQAKTTPSDVEVRGFELGVTGSSDELMRHFGLDEQSIVEACV